MRAAKLTTGVVMGWDLGLAHTGWSCMQLRREGAPLLHDLGVVVTEKSSKKHDVLASADDLRRANELASKMVALVNEFRPHAFAVEAKSLPRNSSSACKIGMAWGAFAAVVQRYSIPVVQASPQEVRKSLGLPKNAGKKDVQDRLVDDGPYGQIPSILGDRRQIPEGQWEHPVDATAVVLACEHSAVFQVLKAHVRVFVGA